MSGKGYIVPNDLLLASPPRDQWHGTTLESDPTQSMITVVWDNPNYEAEFESQAGVIPIGDRWEPMTPEVASLLGLTDTSLSTTSAVPLEGGTVDTTSTTATESVGSALRRMNWPGARLIR